MISKKTFSLPIIQALLAAILFAASAPLSKLFLSDVDPIPLAAFLYLGSGFGALTLIGLQKLMRPERIKEAHLSRPDVPWLLGAVFIGGVLAPIALLFGLQTTPASTASLLLNFESIATALIAAIFFKEAIGKRIAWAIGLVTLACSLLTLTWGDWGFSPGAFIILAACFCWGLDNNFTNQISARDPLQIVVFKGLGAGTFSLLLTFLLDKPLPGLKTIFLAGALGAVSYGLSIALIILAMRALGSARAYALFGSAPFIGVFISFLLFKEEPSLNLWLALPLMLLGAWLMLSEHHVHSHEHLSLTHDHTHTHMDEHHNHAPEEGPPLVNNQHSHPHQHEYLIHTHAHTPDIHHRHTHSKDGDGS